MLEPVGDPRSQPGRPTPVWHTRPQAASELSQQPDARVVGSTTAELEPSAAWGLESRSWQPRFDILLPKAAINQPADVKGTARCHDT